MPASSVITSGAASRYAAALFDLARAEDKLDRVSGDLASLVAMLTESADLRRLIDDPTIGRDERRAAIGQLAERAGFDDLTGKFLGLLADKRRLLILGTIIDSFHEMLAVHRGEVSAEVISAVELGEPQLAELRESVGRFAGSAVRLTARTDASLLGGLVVRVGSRMIDASLKRKLQLLELSMRGVA